ncbi:hypothetical protein V8G54_024070 [Vigna mungo]|uniref:Uncharacterized protein n=1 Tax=Vigna mungo TaxID=3915 RepID=A0AAQ3RPS7_VIGMU
MVDSCSSRNEEEDIPPPPSFVYPNQDPSSPFYKHPSESPSSVVVSPPLSANNFQSCEPLMSRLTFANVFLKEICFVSLSVFSVADFYTNLKSLWEELDNYRTLTPCSCSAHTYRSQDFIIHFLKGLDDHFAMDNPSSSSREINPVINVVFGKARGHPQLGRTKQTHKCELCGCLEHTIDSYFQKNNITSTKCIHCDHVGHSNDVCYTKFCYPHGHPKYPGKARPFNNKNTFGGGRTTVGGTVNNVTTSSSSDVVPTLTHEGERKDTSTLGQGLHITMAQFQQLMSLLNKASGSGGGNS